MPAPPPITKVAVICVELTTVIPVTVIPVPEVKLTLVPLVVKLVPVRVTATFVPRAPVFGETEVRVGAGGLLTVNVTLLEVPFGVVTLTFFAPVVAVGEIAKVAVTDVSLTTTTLLTVIPDPRLMTVVPVSPVPVNVTL